MLTGHTPQGTLLRPASLMRGCDNLYTVVTPSPPTPSRPRPVVPMTTEDSAFPSYTNVFNIVSILLAVNAT